MQSKFTVATVSQKDSPVGRYLLEAKVLEVGEGNNELHRDILADWAFGLRNY